MRDRRERTRWLLARSVAQHRAIAEVGQWATDTDDPWSVAAFARDKAAELFGPTVAVALDGVVSDDLMSQDHDFLRSLARLVHTAVQRDEFAVLCPDVADEPAASAVAERIPGALVEKLLTTQDAVTLTASVGIALGDATSDGPGLLRETDTAMCAPKAAGRNRVEVFDAEMPTTACHRSLARRTISALLAVPPTDRRSQHRLCPSGLEPVSVTACLPPHRRDPHDRKRRRSGERASATIIAAQADVDGRGRARCRSRRRAADRSTAVMLDSVASYQLSVAGGDEESWTQLHALGGYLKGKGVTGLLMDEVASVTGEFVASQHGLSYLADTVLFLRYLEVQGRIGKVIGVLKKRTSGFENTLREFEITPYGLKVGIPLHHLRGMLSGTPEINETTL